MAKDMFDISDDAWEMPQEAVKEFTDREDPQEAFERKIRVLNENDKNYVQKLRKLQEWI